MMLYVRMRLATRKTTMHCRCYIAAKSAYTRIESETLERRNRETGGLLIGRAGIVAGDLILVVAAATGPGPQALHQPLAFAPDIARLQHELEQWRSAFAPVPVDYLGEWHTHPASMPFPSTKDDQQALAILADDSYILPHGFLLAIVTQQDGLVTPNGYFYSRGTQQPILIDVEQFDGEIGQLLGAIDP